MPARRIDAARATAAIQAIAAAVATAIALSACSTFLDLRPTEVAVRLREAPADLTASVHVVVEGADGDARTLFGTVRPVPLVGPRLEVALGDPRVDLVAPVALVERLGGVACGPASNLGASSERAGAAVAARFDLRDGGGARFGEARAASSFAVAVAGAPAAVGERVATYVFVDRPVRLTGVCSDGAANVTTGIDLGLGWNLVALAYESATIAKLSVLDRPTALDWFLVGD